MREQQRSELAIDGERELDTKVWLQIIHLATPQSKDFNGG